MRLVLGRYIAYNSPIHRMDPRLKLFMLISLIVTIFFPVGFSGYVVLSATILSLFIISKLRPIMLLRIFKPIIFMAIILFLIYCFMQKGGNGIDLGWQWGGGGDRGGVSWFVVSEKSLCLACYMGIRIFLMITITTILTATTQPLDLTLALEDLLSPLKLFRFPVHILSTILSIALRMIPTLIEEAARIMKAQASRGIDFKNGKFKDKIKSSVSLIIPLLVSALNKAEDLANAMDSRAYNPKSHRTRYRQYKIKFTDIFIFTIIIGIAALNITQVYFPIVPSEYTLVYLDKFINL